MKFKKITAIAASVLMAGMTVGFAAAANYPAPFVDNGVADVAVVYGTGAGVSSLDQVQAGNIQKSLGTYVKSTGTTTVEGGEVFMLDKSSNHFNYNDALNSVYSSLDSENMDFLADGTYDDGSIDETYTQEISLSNNALALFADNDYNDDEPTVGFKWNNNDDVLAYTMTFDDTISFNDTEDTDLPLLGGKYYVLSADSSAKKMELLDSAEKTVLAEGETVTVAGKTVSIEYISSTGVKFNVDGELTDKLTDHETYELDDGSYIIANEILYTDKETGVSKVEFSIGAGKITIEDTKEIEVNDDKVDGMVGTFSVSGDDLTSITITWNSDDETFLTEENSISMPLFEAIQLIYGGLDYPTDSEMISLDNGETLVLNMDNYDLDLMWFSGSATQMGAEDYELILSTSAGANYTDTNGLSDLTSVSTGLTLMEDNRFLVTSMDNDLTDVETAYYEVSSIDYTDSSDFTVELTDLIGDNDLTFDALEDHDRGDINIELLGLNDTSAYFNFTTVGTLGFNKAVSEKGLVVTLPTSSNITNSSYGYSTITFTEANDDEDVEQGSSFTATIKATSNDKLHVSTTSVSTEEEASDKYMGIVPSALASKISTDQSGDEYDFEIEYFGKEVTADVSVATGGTITSTTSALGDILIKDSEVAASDAESFIVVGGSCINSAAATVLGGAYCGEAFTAATGVGAGEFLIKGMENALNGKFALVVAGYEAADTANGATYLTKKEVDTSKEYKGTSATEAELMVA